MFAKKAASIALVGAMLAGMSVNAFAAAQATGNAVTLSGTLDAAAMAIDVDLPTVTDLTMDPYLSAAEDANPERKQIYTDALTFTNNGDTAVNIKLAGYNVNDLQADGQTASDITISRSAIDNTASNLQAKKDVYLYVAAGTADGQYPKEPEDNKLALSTKQTKAYDADDATSFTAITGGVAMTEDGLAGSESLNLKVLGDMNVKGAWADGDTLSVTVVFDIQPIFPGA